VSGARALCEKLLAYACPLVLLRRGDRPAHRAAPGELPPGFSHLALSNACVHLIYEDERVAAG
jgi:alpha,alpha-trehalase